MFELLCWSSLLNIKVFLMEAYPQDLLLAQKYIYQPNGLELKDFQPETESQDYEACSFLLNDKRIRFRQAKITPTKIGQFVTIWKRVGKSPIMPYDMADPVDLFVISVRHGDQIGQFVFPKDVLRKHGYVSEQGSGGKRAMRVYPPWDVTDSPQAKRTQAWQLKYFLAFQQPVDVSNVLKCYLMAS